MTGQSLATIKLMAVGAGPGEKAMRREPIEGDLICWLIVSRTNRHFLTGNQGVTGSGGPLISSRSFAEINHFIFVGIARLDAAQRNGKSG